MAVADESPDLTRGPATARGCPECGGSLLHVQGCLTCGSCGYSRCG